MLDTKQVSRLKIGGHYPEIPPPIDAVGLTLDFATALDVHNDRDDASVTLHYLGPTFSLEPIFKIWASAPVAWETQALKNICLGYGLYAAADYPSGLPIFIFDGGNDSQFFVKAPLLADPQAVSQWIEGSSSGIRFYLMERQTGIIQTIRVIGMEESFLKALRTVWRANLNNHPTALRQYNNLISTRSNGQLWSAARKWFFIPKLDSFIEA